MECAGLKTVLIVLMCLLPWRAYAQTPDVRVPAGLRSDRLDQLMPAFARETMASYRKAGGKRDLGTLFRLQLVAGEYEQAIETIEAIRMQRRDPPGQPPLFLQYEVFAKAKSAQVEQRQPFERAWQDAFARRFGALDDRVALQAEFGFGGSLPRMRSDLNTALAKVANKRRAKLADAMDLVRAYQVHSAYAEFTPFFDEALHADDALRYSVARDAAVLTPDGARIAVLVVRRTHAPALPALLTFTIYANDHWAWQDAKKAAAHGYVGVVAYTRGKGRSPDRIAPFEHDGGDAAAVIDWIADQPWSDGRTGMYGGSYSGFTQWAALQHKPDGLKAIAASATAAPGIDVPMEGGIFLNFMYPWPFYTASNRSLDDARYGDNERWATLNRAWYESGRAYRDLPVIDGTANPVFSKWLTHPTYDAYWQSMIPQGADFAGIDIPVLTTTGYFDGAQIGALHYFREHLKHRPDADHTLLIGPYEHFTMQTGVPPTVQGYTPDAAARLDLQALRLAWFDHVLKGAPKPALLADRINWQVMGADTWRHAPSLDRMARRMKRVYLVPGPASGPNRLSTEPKPQAHVLQRVDFSIRTDGAWTPPAGVVLTELDPHVGLHFVGDTLTEEIELAGEFHGVLEFTTNKRDVDLALSVFELDAAGRYLELAYWLQRASHNVDPRERQLLEPNAPQRLVIDDTRLIGRKLPAGSRIVVTLGVIKQPDRQLNLGSGKEPSEEVITDSGDTLEIHWAGNSHLEFGVFE
jgi:uncharacterized protein